MNIDMSASHDDDLAESLAGTMRVALEEMRCTS